MQKTTKTVLEALLLSGALAMTGCGDSPAVDAGCPAPADAGCPAPGCPAPADAGCPAPKA